MNYFRLMLVVAMVGVLVPVVGTHAAEQTYTQESFFTLPHTEPAWFTATANGGFVGETVDGYSFTHAVIPNTDGIRLHQFSIGTASFYITDRGIITADSTLMAVSIYLTLV